MFVWDTSNTIDIKEIIDSTTITSIPFEMDEVTEYIPDELVLKSELDGGPNDEKGDKG